MEWTEPPPASDYEQEAGKFVREVEDQCIPCDETDMLKAKLKFGVKCWICDDRWFNDRKQLVDHIEGSGQGGKAHLKFRRRWMEAGQMGPVDWLEFLKQEKEKPEKTRDNAPSTAAASSTMNFTLQIDFDAVLFDEYGRYYIGDHCQASDATSPWQS